MRKMLDFMITLIGLMIMLQLPSSFSHPDFVGCNSDVQDQIIMGSETRLARGLIVAFKVNGEPVACGDTFLEGSELTVVHNLPEQHFIDVKGATFSTPNLQRCPTRMFELGSRATFEEKDTKLVNVQGKVSTYGAQAEGYSTVSYTSTCTITKVDAKGNPVVTSNTALSAFPNMYGTQREWILTGGLVVLAMSLVCLTVWLAKRDPKRNKKA